MYLNLRVAAREEESFVESLGLIHRHVIIFKLLIEYLTERNLSVVDSRVVGLIVLIQPKTESFVENEHTEQST